MATTVFLSPIGNDTPFYANGTQLSGGKLYTFAAGSSTMLATYTDNTGTVANANPIILNSEGYPAGSTGNRVAIWLVQSRTYKFLLQNAAGVTQWSLDNIAGQNDVIITGLEWIGVASNATNPLTPLTATSFSFSGDQTADALPGRRIRTTNASGAQVYSTIVAASFSAGRTTVTVANDGGASLDGAFTLVEYGLLRPTNVSVPADSVNVKAPTITAAATTDIWKIAGNLAHITGTTPITSFGTAFKAGDRRRLIFDSATPITYNASTLVLPNASSIVTQANDILDVTADTTTKMLVSGFTGIPPGMVMDFGGTVAPAGWLECDGSAVSRTTYAALFAAIASNYGVGDGTTTFNLPDFRGRARIGKGTGTYVSRFSNSDIDAGANTIAVPVNTSLITGTAVVYHSATTVDSGLVQDTTYYVVRLSPTSISLSDTLAHAQNGTNIMNLAGDGSGAMTLTVTLSARTVGQVGGEEAHAMSSVELLAHTHTWVRTDTSGGSTGGMSGLNALGTPSTSSTGSNAAMNVMQPFSVTMAVIKY